MNSALEHTILAHVNEDDIVAMARDVINIPSPTGFESGMSGYMRRTFENMGLAVSWQEVEEGRANVIGRWEGTGGGRCLMFNGHVDTSYTGQEQHLTGRGYKPRAVVEGGTLYGLGIYNMKGALVCYIQAVRALRAAGVKLRGDVIVAAVVGEIEKTQWGEDFVGREFRGYGVGSHYLVTHGVVPDMCILGEPTDMHLVLGHFGSLWVRISTHGPFMHTGFSTGRQHENSIQRMHDAIGAVLEWSAIWSERAAYGNKRGLVNLGGIRGGHAWRASRTPERTDLFLDVRVPPTIPMSDARREVEGLVTSLRGRFPDYGIESETYLSVPGAEISENHPLVKVIETNHRRVTGETAKRDTVLWSSDASVLTRFGIETVNYGPSSGPRDAEGEKVRIKTLVDITKIYALTAADLCEVAP
jgi:acetylornithine deacetylase/succinyl-diaminopimelate desuccinylase-like protein